VAANLLIFFWEPNHPILCRIYWFTDSWGCGHEPGVVKFGGV